ncbi:MAG: amidohydrolase family protein [Acidobacteria bacterium]|nr:amidohydrolase family protein [Acidobacteriota bacterium]
MPVFQARWVLPISQPPIRDGWVQVEGGKIVAVDGPMDQSDEPVERSSDEPMARCAILPGLVNAHTHLELSWMRGQISPAPSMPTWVERLMALRRTVGHEPSEPIRDAILEARAAGTTLVGDITNTLAAYEPLALSGLSAAIFRELLGFNVIDSAAVVAQAQAQIDALPPSARLRSSIVPHAPYSVSPALLREIARAASGDARISIHLGESAEEVEFLQTGRGRWQTLLTGLGVWSDAWVAPGSSPVDYIEQHGLLNERLLAVHCVQLEAADLGKLAGAGATVVACPRSNRWTGAGVPPIERFYRSGVRVAVGTDSLGSVEDLNVFGELALMRQLAPAVPARALLESATKQGADALGFGDQLGTIAPGKRAELIAVRLPEGIADVEEYLVSGVQPHDIRWLDAD